MAITYVGGDATAYTANGTTVAFTLPGSLQADDFMLAFVERSLNDAGSVWLDDGGGGNGWVLLDQQRDTGGRDREPAVFYKKHSGSESNPTFSYAVTAPRNGVLVVYRSVDPTELIDVFAFAEAENTSNPDAVPVTTTFANCMVVTWNTTTHDDVTAQGVPTGYTARQSVFVAISDSWDHTDQRVADKIATAIGTETPGSWNNTVDNTTPEYSAYTVALVPIQEGISDVDPAEFNYSDTDIDINGTNFEASQGTGTVYISDATTLAGSANEVEIDGGINTWSDTVINLDLSGLSSAENAALKTLGPGARYVIVVNDSADEYSLAVTAHWAMAFSMSLSGNFADGDATTGGQLNPPAGKTSGDFDAGKMCETSNPAPSIDITSEDYTEIEWCFQATTNAEDSTAYQFRVTKAGTVIDTYTVIPTLTIAAAAGGTRPKFSPLFGPFDGPFGGPI